MKKGEKKQIRKTVGAALSLILENLKISKPSKRTVRAISKVSTTLRKDLWKVKKKQSKKNLKVKTLKKKSLPQAKKKDLSNKKTTAKRKPLLKKTSAK